MSTPVLRMSGQQAPWHQFYANPSYHGGKTTPKQKEPLQRQKEKANSKSARAGTRTEEWMCSGCYRTNFLNGPRATTWCRGEGCGKQLNPVQDAYIDKHAQRTDWPTRELHKLGLCSAPVLATTASSSSLPPPPPPLPIPPQSQQQTPSWSEVAQGRQQRSPQKEPSLQQKLEGARSQLRAAQSAGWDKETVVFLQERVDGFSATLAAQQPAWQRLQGAKKRLRAAADRVENAAEAVTKWQAELAGARTEMANLRRECAGLEDEAAQTLAKEKTQAPPSIATATMITNLQQTLTNLAQAVEGCWLAGESSHLAQQGGVPSRLAEALRATHAALTPVQEAEPQQAPPEVAEVTESEMGDDEMDDEEPCQEAAQQSAAPTPQATAAQAAAEVMRQSAVEMQQPLCGARASGGRRRPAAEQPDPERRDRSRSPVCEATAANEAGIAAEVAAARQQCSSQPAAPPAGCVDGGLFGRPNQW